MLNKTDMQNKNKLFYICYIIPLFIFLIPLTPLEATIISDSGMVVTAHPMASQFALDILKKGGNAVDAAVGAALLLSVVEPFGSGLGGGGGMLIYLHEPDSLTFINYYARAPHKPPNNLDKNANKVLVPGTIAGLYHALTNYGTLKWEKMVLSVVREIKNGFRVNQYFHETILDFYEKIYEHPQTASIYLIDEMPPEVGAILFNKPIAETLKKIAAHGPDIFYNGEIADSIEAEITRSGGTLRKTDLSQYHVWEVKPVQSTYRGLKYYSAPPPFSGANLIEILNILELKNLNQMGHFTNNPQTLKFMAEAIAHGYSDRLYYTGDPLFYELPTDIIISKEFAESRFKMILDNYFTSEFQYENNYFSLPEPKQKIDKNGSTTHLSVVDAKGNAVSLTQTLNHFWGSGISVCGFLLNNGMTSFYNDSLLNCVESWKQPRTTISPAIFFKNNQLYLVIGTPGGGRIISTMAEVICNIIDFEMDADDANLAPRFALSRKPGTILFESRFEQELLDGFTELGYKTKSLGELNLYFGGVQLILIDEVSQKITGSSDQRRAGSAIGY